MIVKGRTEPIEIYEVLDAEAESSRRLKLDTLELYARGIHYYKASADGAVDNLCQARAAFAQVLSINPQDKTARLYCDRINAMLDRGLPENWSGAWTFSQKE